MTNTTAGPRFSLVRRVTLLTALCHGLGIHRAAAAAGPSGALRMAYLPKQVNNPYHVMLGQGVMEAARELGAQARMLGPTTAQALAQEPFIDQLIAERLNAVILAANEAVALLPKVRELIAVGTKIVAVDADLATDARDLFINQASQEGVGRAQMQLMAKLMDWQGEFAILSATVTASNQNAWIYWMLQELRRPAYKNMKMTKVLYGNDDAVKSREQCMALLQNSNLRGIICPTTVGILASAEYVASSPFKGKVHITGLGTPNQMRPFVKDGTVQAFQLWNPVDLGYLAAYAAASLTRGQISGTKGDTFTAGRLGDYIVGSKGEVILGVPTTFDVSNIDRFHF